MFKDVARYIRVYDICQRTKVKQASPVRLIDRRIAPWTAANFMRPFPCSKSGLAYVLVIQDLFTKWIECHTLKAANGKLISEALEDLVVSRWYT